MRPERILEDGATYYVGSEVNRNAMDLQNPDIKETFLSYINRAKEKYPFQLFDFCIMDNYFHLLIKPANGKDLSKIMQWIKGNFARYWNKIHNNKSGHLWGKRFVSKIVRNVKHLFEVLTYIDESPKKAGMVKRAEDWKFGGLYHHLHGIMYVVNVPRSALPKLFFIGKVIEGTG